MFLSVGAYHWLIEGGARDAFPLHDPTNFFHFHAVFGKKTCQIRGFRLKSGVGAPSPTPSPVWEILDPPLLIMAGFENKAQGFENDAQC